MRALLTIDNLLTPRQLQAVQLITSNLSLSETGQHLGVTYGTTRRLLDRAYKRLGLRTRAEFIAAVQSSHTHAEFIAAVQQSHTHAEFIAAVQQSHTHAEFIAAVQQSQAVPALTEVSHV